METPPQNIIHKQQTYVQARHETPLQSDQDDQFMKYDFMMKGKDKTGKRENLTKLMNDMRNKLKQIEDSNWMFEMQKDAYLPDIMPHNI